MSSSNTITVNLSNDHVKRVSKSTPIRAIEELVWNSLDADATEVSIRINKNGLGNESITIDDNGEGISTKQANSFLSYIGNSWKAKKDETTSGRPLHGQKGEGRFKTFSLGSFIEWDSTYKERDTFHRIKIYFKSDNGNKLETIKEQCDSNVNKTRLKVTITNLPKRITNYNFDDLKDELTQTFAAHLYSYPEIKIYINGYEIEPNEAIQEITSYEIEVPKLEGIHTVRIIEWTNIKAKQLFLCKKNGTVLKDLRMESSKIRSLGYSFSAYLLSDYITELDSEHTLDLFDMQTEGKELLSEAYKKVNEHFKKRKDKEDQARLDKWKELGIYPFEDAVDLGNIEKAKRGLFDIIASKVEDNLPKFEKADNRTKKFTFKLLSQSLQDNPQSIQKIITEVLNLNQEEQDNFAQLLNKTSLSSIIKSAKIVADRLDFLEGLESLVFKHKKTLLERDQLHKILDNEAWIFDEHFALSGTEKRLEEVLEIHLKELGKRSDDDRPVLINDDKQGRVDLMLSKAVQVRPGHYDYLVVELKRPSQNINDKVISQIMGYGMAVKDDARFDKSKSNWKFIVISNELDKMAEARSTEKSRPHRCVYHEDKIEVYAFPWSEVISNAKARLKFYQDQLQYEADSETTNTYLTKMYKEFLPNDYKSTAQLTEYSAEDISKEAS